MAGLRTTLLSLAAMNAALSVAIAGDEATCRAAQRTCERDGRQTQCSGMSKAERDRCEALLYARCAKDYTVCVQAPIVGGATPVPAPAPTQPATTPVTSATASSCATLFAKVRQASSVDALWVTNYLANGYRFMAFTPLKLFVPGPAQDITGNGTRVRFSGTVGGVAQSNAPVLLSSWATSNEPVSIRIRNDGTILFQDRYGPYTPVCWGDRFAGVYSHDSLETFTFNLR